jgi:hypothetical protein
MAGRASPDLRGSGETLPACYLTLHVLSGLEHRT